jgi:hypothetical protein
MPPQTGNIQTTCYAALRTFHLRISQFCFHVSITLQIIAGLYFPAPAPILEALLTAVIAACPTPA